MKNKIKQEKTNN